MSEPEKKKIPPLSSILPTPLEYLCGLVDNLGSKPLPKQQSASYSTYSTYSNASILKIQLTSIELSLIIKYIIENNESFIKFKSQITSIQNEIIQQKITGEYFNRYTRPEFCKKLPNIKKGTSAKLYKKIKSMTDLEIQQLLQQILQQKFSNISNNNNNNTQINGELKVNNNKNNKNNNSIQLPNYISYQNIDINIILNGTKQIENYNINEFLVYLYLIFVKNKYNKTDIDILMNGIIKLELSTKAFLNIKRIDFCKRLKTYNILAAKAGRVYKLIHNSINENITFGNLKFENRNNNKLSYGEIGDIAVTNFQITARKMLSSINESMKTNNINGKQLVQYYITKKDLEKYLQQNVRHKSAIILTDMLWNDYINDKENKLFNINQYDRKQLLKYFISLHMNYIKNVFIKHKLDSNKCLLLKRKGLCKILTNNCGLTIGTATNLVDNIYTKIE